MLFLTNWLFSAFTQSLQSASANVRKLSENHKCLAKKRKNRALLLYLITERAEYQRKAIYLHLNTIICNGDNEQNKGVRPPRFYGVGYRGFCAEDEYIAVGDEKATGEGGAY